MRHILTSQRNIVMLGVKKMGKMINTVCGTVSSDDLGIVLAHEHIVFGFPGFQGDLSYSLHNDWLSKCLRHLAHKIPGLQRDTFGLGKKSCNPLFHPNSP